MTNLCHSIILVHTKQIVGCGTMIINIFVKTFNNERFREAILWDLLNYFIICSKIVVLIIDIRSLALFRYQIFMIDFISFYSLLFKLISLCCIILIFTLVICILVINTIIKILVVKLLILSIQLSDPNIKSDRHIFVLKHILYLFI